MIATDERASVTLGPPSRRSEEIRLLEDLWAAPATAVQEGRRIELPRWWLAVALGGAWIVFLATLFALAPAADPTVATPAWMEQATGAMFTVLLLTSFGFASRALGYGASGFAALLGTSLGVGCFTIGHGGFWPIFQVAGFVALVGLSGFGLVRARRSA